jgi:hypothetical protein
MNHQPVDTGEECCVPHIDAAGNLLPSCLRCAVCRQWVRPEGGNGDCPGPPPPGPPKIISTRYPPDPEPTIVEGQSP